MDYLRVEWEAGFKENLLADEVLVLGHKSIKSHFL